MRILLFFLLTLTTTHAAPPPKKILFIGNSYTAQIRQAVTGLIAASPHQDTQLEFITPGGRTLQQHLHTPKILERIATGGWDLVVLQDQSQTPALHPDAFLKSSAALHAAITAAKARTVYYETWGRRDGDTQNAPRFPTYLSMQQALSKSYRTAANRDQALLVPVGTAWQTIRTQHPALGHALYTNDGSHPSSKGALLAAACFYRAFFNASPTTIPIPYIHGLPAKEATLLKKIAAETTP